MATQFENESTAVVSTLEKCREVTGCPAGVDLQDHLRQLAAENAFILQLMHEQAGCFNAALIEGFHELVMGSGSESLIDIYRRRLQPAIQCVPPTPATDAYLAGIKADAFEEATVELERVDTIASTRVIAFKLREFAKQLRGVSK
ncbi:TPA: hypothetical protein ACGQTX_003013 [Raoultella ornithinolytica]